MPPWKHPTGAAAIVGHWREREQAALDATVVRLLLVPAVMHLLGTAPWWLPKWLGHILPRMDIEGTPEPPAARAAQTATASTGQAAQRAG